MSATLPGTKKKRRRSSSPQLVPLESIHLEPRPSKSMPHEATLNKPTTHECASSSSFLPQRIPSESIPEKPIPREQSPEPTPESSWVPTHIHTIGPHTPRIELEHPATKMTLTHDDKYLAVVVGERELCLYDTSNFELVSRMIVLEPSHKYNELRFAPLLMENNGYMLVTRKGKIDIYDFNPRVKVSIPSVHVPLNDAESQGSSAGSASDGREESHGGKGVWSTLAKYTTMCVPEHRITLSGYCIKFSKDGSFMTYTMYRKQPMVVIWDVKEQQLRKAVNPEVKQFDVTICPNSRLIATASNSSGLIRVWEAANGHCVSVFGVAEDKVDNVIFSPNSKRLAVQYRKGERLHQIYDIPTGQIIFSLSNSYHPRAWSFGGNILAACSATRDRAIILVGATTGAERVRWDLGQGDSESIPSKHRQRFFRTGRSYHIRFLDHGAKLTFRSANGSLDLYDFLSLAKHRYQGWCSSNYLHFSNNGCGFIVSDHENKALIFQDFE